MKKLLTAAAITAAMGISAQADFLRVEMGAGIWNNDITGSLRYKNYNIFNAGQLGYTDENKGYAWLMIKHPVPILPNIRLEYSDVKFSGQSLASFDYYGFRFDANAATTLQAKQYDAVLYYNLLDNTAWTTVDLGVDLKYLDASFEASGNATVIGIGGVPSIQYVDESQDILIPLLYGRLRFEIPFIDVGIEGDARYITYKNSSVLDYSIKADYTLVGLFPFDIGIEAGYRFENFDIDGGDVSGWDTNIDVDVDGFFAGAVIRF